MTVADAVDAASGVPVTGPVLRLALLAVQAGALLVLADDHAAIRVAVTTRCMDVLTCVLQRTVEALRRDQTTFVGAHIEQLCGLLRRLEALLTAVERSYFAGDAKGVLLDGVVRGWEADLSTLHDMAVGLTKDGAHHYEVLDKVDQLHTKMSQIGHSVGLGVAAARDLADYDVRFNARPPDPSKYVSGVATPGRAECTLVSALRAYVESESREGPRLGVYAIGGSGKSTACAGVAACDYVREHFPRGTMWVQLSDISTLQTVVDAVVALVYRVCGADTARRLLELQVHDDVVAEAAQHTQLVPAAEAAQRLVVIDDVLYSKRKLLQLLLRVVPPATPVLFTTRSEPVVSLLGSQPVLIDGLPDCDARVLLAQAVGKPVVAGVAPFSPVEEAGWVERVLRKTEGHALSLSIICAMIADRGGAWFHVVQALERRWMEPDFGLLDGGLDMQPSVRATLEASLALLPDAESGLAFARLGILPTSVKVGTLVLARLWRLQVDPGGVDGAHSAGRACGGAGEMTELSGVDRQVNQLVRAGLLRRDVDVSNGVVDGVIVHPVVGEFAKSLLGDNCRVLHDRLMRDYLDDVGGISTDEHGLRAYPFWKIRNDGYWFNNVAFHAAAGGDVSAVVSLMDPRWQRAREASGSPLAYQGDVEIVLTSLRSCVDNPDHEMQRTPLLLSRAYRALAWAYSESAGGNRAVNTEAAVDCCRRALTLTKRKTTPLEWAATQHKLGIAYLFRIGGDKAANVEAAVACYERALEVWTRESAPVEWAWTQHSLGNAYLGRIGGDKAANVAAAVACYERALEVRTRESAPVEWARTQHNLGIAHLFRIGGDKAANVEAAVACYERALEVLTRESAPVEWARTQTCLGNAYLGRIGGDKAANVAAAVACYERALEVLTREWAPMEWARTQHKLGNAHRKRVGGDKAANVEAAVACYERALEVLTREWAPMEWASTQHDLGNAYRKRVGGDKAANVEAAVACYERALEVLTREWAPMEWASTQHDLGNAYRKRVGGDKAANVEAAVACYERALEVWTRESAPVEWATTQRNLDVAKSLRVGGEQAANVEAAVAHMSVR